MSNGPCIICNSELSVGLQVWHLVCKSCGYEKANFQPTINLMSAHQLINENIRESGLRALRVSNFKKILAVIKSMKLTGDRLLDVGCAHGWFLEVAKTDFEVYGLEPDKDIFDVASKTGLPIRKGYFPAALHDNEVFDVITFNDVIEHIPDIKNILVSCHQALKKDGLLVLNLPSSRGLFYKLSNLFCRLGFHQFFNRLWQKDLPSPHVHYFNPNNLLDLLKNNGFEIKVYGSLPTIRLAGLYSRIAYTGNLGFIARIFIYTGVASILPILKILPKDAIYVIANKK